MQKNLKNNWNPCTWVLIWEYSARAIQWIPTQQGLDGFQKSLHSSALDKSSLSIGRVNTPRFWHWNNWSCIWQSTVIHGWFAISFLVASVLMSSPLRPSWPTWSSSINLVTSTTFTTTGSCWSAARRSAMRSARSSSEVTTPVPDSSPCTMTQSGQEHS